MRAFGDLQMSGRSPVYLDGHWENGPAIIQLSHHYGRKFEM